MTKTILFVAMLMVAGCHRPKEITPEERQWLDEVNNRIITIKGCEYIEGSYRSPAVHLANCSNPIHCYCDTLETPVYIRKNGDSVYLDTANFYISISPKGESK